MAFKQGITYDDVLLVPKHSDISSRSQIDTTVDLGKGVVLQLPIIPANMKSIAEDAMCEAMLRMGGLAILHRFMTVERNVELFSKFKGNVGCSVGIKEEEYRRADALLDAGCRIFCVDVAHGDHTLCERMVAYLARMAPEALLIAGNVATADGALRLWKAGADVIKVGVGPGSLCTTRIETGNGVPQLTALMDVHAARREHKAGFAIIADGGIKNAGDIVKALCFAEAVMVGNLIAGTAETPGQVITIQDKQYKQYEGSSTHKTNHVEGVTAVVPVKGTVEPIIRKLMEGVRSGCSYQGARTLAQLQRDPQFVLISQAGLSESLPHLIMR